MATEHEHWQAQSEVYALGALDGQELQDYQAHLASGCKVCQAYLRETHATLNLLHGSLQPELAPPAVKARLFDQIGVTSAEVASTAKARQERPKFWRRMIGTIAAAVAGIIISATYYSYRYEPRHTLYSSVIELLRDPATRDSPLYGAGPTPHAKGRFLWNESGEGHIFVSDLPAAPDGKMYAVWTIAEQSAPRYVGTIQTDAAGKGGLHINAARSDRPVETFAVTVEPIGSTAAPTGPMVLISKSS